MAERIVLVLGAGRSSGFLIEYLAERANVLNAKIVVADQNLEWARSKVEFLPSCLAAIVSPSEDKEGFEELVASATLVISLLPVHLHLTVAHACLKYQKPMFTASYQTAEMEVIQGEIASKGLLFLNECGCDPGLDHMTAVQILDSLKASGHQILSYEGYTGGLVAPVSDDNPWHYKFSWNPRNVILAGQNGPAQFLRNSKTYLLNYPELFRQVVEVNLPDFPDLVGYFNRNSLPYADLYGIPAAQTVIRGTLRHRHFCTAWFPIAFWGMNSSDVLDSALLADLPSQKTLIHKLSNELGYTDAECKVVIELWDYLGIWELLQALKDPRLGGRGDLKSNRTANANSFSPPLLPFEDQSAWISPTDWLEKRMIDRMSLAPTDQDMVLMTHLIQTISPEGCNESHRCTLKLEGEGGDRSAMAKTVGLPLAMAVELYLQGKINETGLLRPLGSLWYGSILPALEQHGIRMQHHVTTG
ncbi:MAG: hypothetical protein FJ343_06995 [Sphingomonadales bacterium]|nr:hypothetical protein [Sphingomonadales bacterium]